MFPEAMRHAVMRAGSQGRYEIEWLERRVLLSGTPPAVISELLINPPGALNSDQYIELRSSTANYTFPSGTYLVSVCGDPLPGYVVGTTTPTTYPTGTVTNVFDLSGVTTGSNGFLVILQRDNTSNDNNGESLVEPQATVLDNGHNPDGSPAVGTGAGFGNNLQAPGSSIVGHRGLSGPVVGGVIGYADLLTPSATYLLIHLIQATPTPQPGDQVDAPALPGGPPTGTLHGSEVSNWTVWDSIGIAKATTSSPGDFVYGAINFVNSAGTTDHATPGSTVVSVSFTADYVGRANGNSTSNASDWVASSGIQGHAPTWGTGSTTTTYPSSDANRPLNNLGDPNFDTSQPALVSSTSGVLNYALGSGPVVVDPDVIVTDPDSFFLGSAQVAINGYNFNTDSLGFINTSTITGVFDSGSGILKLKGFDTFDNWNAALESVTFSYSRASVGSHTVTFEANDGSVLSNQSTQTINIGSAPASDTWTGSASNEWEVANNWNTGVVPGSTTSASINSGTVTAIAGFQVASLSLTGGGPLMDRLTLPAGNQIVATGAVHISGLGTLDILNTKMIVHNASSAAAQSALGPLIGLLRTGLNTGGSFWGGSGITSSIAAADPYHVRAIGAIVNADSTGGKLYGSGAPLGLFGGEDVATTDVLMKETYFGDTDLTGSVDAADYSATDNGYVMHLTGWKNGDFNYDGTVNAADYSLIDQSFAFQSAAGGPLMATAAKLPPASPEFVHPSQVVALPDLFQPLSAGLLSGTGDDPLR
jgi:hypothetical protein